MIVLAAVIAILGKSFHRVYGLHTSSRPSKDFELMPRLRKLLVCFCFALVGCGYNIGALQSRPAHEYQSSLQSRTEKRNLDQTTDLDDRAGSSQSGLPEVLLSDLSTGNPLKVIFDRSGANATVAIQNGSDVSMRLQTDPRVTGVFVDGGALMPTALKRVSTGNWQATFQYWDASNTLNSKSKITVLLNSGSRSIEKITLSVTTVHDS